MLIIEPSTPSFLDYELQKEVSGGSTFTPESSERGRRELDTAFRKIEEPWRVLFDDRICKVVLGLVCNVMLQ